MQQAKDSIRGITRLSNKIRRSLEAFSFRDALSGAEGRTLHFLLANSDIEIFQKDVEEEFGIRPSTASVLLKKMESDGLITRIATGYDARLKRIVITGKGLEYKQQVMMQLDGLEENLIKDISSEELDVFLRVIAKMSRNMS